MANPLDEPLAGLDPEGRDQMLRLIGRLRGFGIYTLVSSHVLKDIESTCDWILMIEGGRIVRNGSLDSLTAGDTVRVEVLDDPGTAEGHPPGPAPRPPEPPFRQTPTARSTTSATRPTKGRGSGVRRRSARWRSTGPGARWGSGGRHGRRFFPGVSSPPRSCRRPGLSR